MNKKWHQLLVFLSLEAMIISACSQPDQQTPAPVEDAPTIEPEQTSTASPEPTSQPSPTAETTLTPTRPPESQAAPPPEDLTTMESEEEETPTVEVLEVDTQIETIAIIRKPLPPEAYSTYQTDQWVHSLAFDDDGNMWAHTAGGYLRWDTSTGDNEWLEPPLEIATRALPSSFSTCEYLANRLGLEYASFRFFTSCLYSPLDGTYWFSTSTYPFPEEGGIYSFDGSEWTHHTSEVGLADDEVSQVIVDDAGLVWAATFGGISQYDGEMWTDVPVLAGDTEITLTAAAVDGAGNLWLGRRDGRMVRLDGQGWSEHDIGIEEAIGEILVDSSGGLWIPDWPVLYRLEDGDWTAIELDPPENYSFQNTVNDVDRTSAGQVWIGTDIGALLLDDTDLTWFVKEDGLVDNNVLDVMIGPEDSPWFATAGGVSHYDGSSWQSFTIQEGPGIAYPMSALTDAAGNVWFGGADGVAALDSLGNWQRYPEFSDFPGLINFAMTPDGALFGAGCSGIFEFVDGAWLPIFGEPESVDLDRRLPWCPTKMAISQDGTIWVNQMDIYQGYGHGALRMTDTGYEWYGDETDAKYNPDMVTVAPWRDAHVTAILPRADGAIWFGTEEGIHTFSEDKWAVLPDDVYGDSSWITTATLSPAGEAWLGTPVGLARFDGQLWTTYQLADETRLDFFAIQFDESGTGWFSTLDGIGRFDGETIHLYTYGDIGPFQFTNPDLLGASIVGIVDSIAFGPDNSLWMAGGPTGIIRIDLASLE